MRLWGHMINPTPLTTEFNKVNNNSNTVQIEKLINVEGDVVDGERVTKQIKNVAKKIAHNEVSEFVTAISESITYGSSSKGSQWNYKYSV